MFNIGDKVVYPMHGAGVIEAIEEKEILGARKRYYIMNIPIGDMKVMIPMDNVDQIGLREVIDTHGVEQVLTILRDNHSKMSTNWNRRYRANMEKIKSGDIFQVAEVVRNLMLREREKGLSTGERKMLDSAKQILVSELVLAQNTSAQDVDEILNQFFDEGHHTI
ncbi:CarD family transcriptional regulator [Dethiobacter alkaliphilus]|uniref:Transcriptional regulator, CarD family n=1 Tax=Dethiobacter alkaliphilus AHT 1 TaxID=555088 RepID=C0GIM0_DETAL|nr:CarD family transcriptional regulator [Dethiobacter alkaliphilus]EEG76881.1 transcriptional regulator, CarD family [Dethiobacter alkaliphilus AHT 1]MCW3491052.1 CarD family transcriptional regulator [Dethiobacter alkaliphilus]